MLLKRKFILLSIIMTFGMLFSQSEMSPVFMGSSWSNGMLLRNLDAVGYNPANMALSGNHDYSINFLPVSVAFENTYKKEFYDDYIGVTENNSWSEDDVDKILSELDDTGHWRINNRVKVGVIGFSLGKEAYNLNINTVQDVKIPKELLELALKGNEFDREYRFDDLDGEHYQYASLEYSFSEKLDFLSFKKLFKEVTIGATFRYMFGFPGVEMNDLQDDDKKMNPAYFKLTNIEGYFLANDITGPNSIDSGATSFKGTVDILKSEAGHGIGVDIGAAAKITDDMTVGFSITNLISGISWYQNNKVYRYNYEMNGIFVNQLENIEEAITDLDSSFTVGKIFTSIPTELNLGFSWGFNYENGQKLVWTAAYNQGFINEQASTIIPKLSTGISYTPIDWFTLRSGVTGGGDSYFESAIGFSLEFAHYAFDFGVESKHLYGSGSKGLGIAIGQKFYW